MMNYPEPAAWLDEDEIEEWRESEASILTAENTACVDEWQQARAFYYERFRILAGIYDKYHLDRTRDLDINPATGSVKYLKYDVDLEDE